MVPEALMPRHPFPVRRRGVVLLGLVLGGVWAFLFLDLSLSDLLPHHGGWQLAARFFTRALSPALRSEADFVPPGTPPLLLHALEGAVTTVRFAASAMSLALLLGIALGFLASSAWWSGDPAGAPSLLRGALRRTLAPGLYAAARVVIAGMRSVHELLWAVLFLAAFGLHDFAAILALAIPFGGTLAKVFSEMVDEAPRGPALALRGAGASPLQVYCFGLVPQALPDMVAYSFYRFECALRSAAVLGFFGFPTLGLHIRQSFQSTNYGEVWTYLYVLVALIVLSDVWSGAVRRRLLA